MIPKTDIVEFFNFLNKDFKIVPFDIPEIEFESGNISFYETVIICLLCKNIKPKNILEFGTFNGRTTVNMGFNSEEASLITVDLPKEQINNVKFPLEGQKRKNKYNEDELGFVGKTDKLYEKYSKLNVYQLWMDTADFPVEDYKNRFDLIFIDASHSYENVLNDYYIAKQCIKNGGFILCHDYNGWSGVTKALNEIYEASFNKWNFINIKDTSFVLNYCKFY